MAGLPKNHRMDGFVPEVTAFTTSGVPNDLVHGAAPLHVFAMRALLDLRRNYTSAISELSTKMTLNALAHAEEVEAMTESVHVEQQEARVAAELAASSKEKLTAVAVTLLCVALVSRQFTEHFNKNRTVAVPAGLKVVEVADLSQQFHGGNRHAFGRFPTEAQLGHAHPEMSWDEMTGFVNIETSEIERVLPSPSRPRSGGGAFPHVSLRCYEEADNRRAALRDRS